VRPQVEDVGWPAYDAGLPVADLRSAHARIAGRFLDAVDASHARGLLADDRRLVQVFHLVTHGTHHRTQFITMLRLLGQDAPFEAGDFAGWQRGRTRAAQ